MSKKRRPATQVRAETLTGRLLDAWVARAIGQRARNATGLWLVLDDQGFTDGLLPEYSTDWGAGGPLLRPYGIGLSLPREDGTRQASIKSADRILTALAADPLVAAMRVLVMQRCGIMVPVHYPAATPRMTAGAVSLAAVLQIANPLHTSPWNCPPVTPEDVLMALAANHLIDQPVAPGADGGDHAARVAWFIRHGWTAPIQIDVGVPSIGHAVLWPIEDGNHRLMAAAMRGDVQILAEISGEVAHIEHLFGKIADTPNAQAPTRPPADAGDLLLAVADAAADWWQAHRPSAWSEEQHAATPAVNCPTEPEQLLAHAVAQWSALCEPAPPDAHEILLRVADMAVVWWAMKRPLQWGLAQHFATPNVNCPAAGERRLAQAVARWCAAQAVPA